MQKLVWEYGIKISPSYRNKKWDAARVTSHSYLLNGNGSIDIKEGKMTVTYGYIKQRKTNRAYRVIFKSATNEYFASSAEIFLVCCKTHHTQHSFNYIQYILIYFCMYYNA